MHTSERRPVPIIRIPARTSFSAKASGSNAARPSSRFVPLDPPGPPYIEGYTEGETVQRGQNVELACRSRGGNPPAQIIWFRNDEQITTAYRTEGSSSESVLSFTARAQDEKARYRCEVSNIMSVQPMKVHVDLTVLCKCAR